jgi:spermidine synthase
MGYTVRSALNELGPKAQVVVAELVPEVVKWNRGILSDLAGAPLDDDRVTLCEADVAQMIRTSKYDYNAILLDVDNAPEDLTRKDNYWLYSFEGLNTIFAALRPKGVLAIWSSIIDPEFVKRLRNTGFAVQEARVRGRGRGGGHYIVWTAVRS